jgi:hypothetical protein
LLWLGGNGLNWDKLVCTKIFTIVDSRMSSAKESLSKKISIHGCAELGAELHTQNSDKWFVANLPSTRQ